MEEYSGHRASFLHGMLDLAHGRDTIEGLWTRVDLREFFRNSPGLKTGSGEREIMKRAREQVEKLA